VAWAADHGAAAAAAKFGMSTRSVLRWVTARARKAEQSAAAKGERAAAVVATAAASPGAGARRARHGRRFSVAEKKAILEHAEAHGVSAAAAQFTTSRWSIYEWLRRRRASVVGKSDPDAELAPRSSRPKRIAGKLSEERHHLIAETWLRNQALGPRQVRNVLRRNHALRVGTSTVRRVMEEQGYVPPRITVERRPSRRYEAVRPNQQWHLDFVQFFLHVRHAKRRVPSGMKGARTDMYRAYG
jgi:transposase